MKPFDIQKAIAGEPVVTRDGKPVTDIKWFPTAIGWHRVVGLINNKLAYWGASGYASMSESRSDDIFMALKKETIFVNVYQIEMAGKKEVCISHYQTEEEAHTYATKCTISKVLKVAVPIEIEVE